MLQKHNQGLQRASCRHHSDAPPFHALRRARSRPLPERRDPPLPRKQRPPIHHSSWYLLDTSQRWNGSLSPRPPTWTPHHPRLFRARAQVPVRGVWPKVSSQGVVSRLLLTTSQVGTMGSGLVGLFTTNLSVRWRRLRKRPPETANHLPQYSNENERMLSCACTYIEMWFVVVTGLGDRDMYVTCPRLRYPRNQKGIHILY